MKFGVALGRLNPAFFVPVVDEAERLGYESVWLPEHLVFPIEMGGSPFPGEEHPPVPPSTPVFDAFAYLSFLAGRTERVKLATHVYLLGLRHPFISARAIATLDIVSGGRAIVGIGAGWLRPSGTPSVSISHHAGGASTKPSTSAAGSGPTRSSSTTASSSTSVRSCSNRSPCRSRTRR